MTKKPHNPQKGKKASSVEKTLIDALLTKISVIKALGYVSNQLERESNE